MSVPKYPGLVEEEGVGSYNMADTMDPDLYTATKKGDILEFIRAMENSTLGRHHHPPSSCIQLDPQKNTVLHIATSFGHYEIVKLICKDLPFFVVEKNVRGDTALHIAAKAGDSLLVELLVDSDFREDGLGEKNSEGNTALHEALINCHEEVAHILICKNLNMVYSPNKEGKSLLYLAAEAGYVNVVRILMENPVGNYTIGGKSKNKSPVCAATHARNIEVLKLLWEKDQSSFQFGCCKGRNPLHAAAGMGYIEGVDFLLINFHELAYQKDKQGFYPIHLAAKKGLIDVIKLILRHRPDTMELRTSHGQNILHLVVKSGKYKAVYSMLKMPELGMLINDKDAEGNTPLHLATSFASPKIVAAFLWDERVTLKLENNKGLTAHDVAEEHMVLEMPSFQRLLACMALRVVGAPGGREVKSSQSLKLRSGDKPPSESWRDKVHVLLLVATFIATVTYAAGITVPGGYNNTNPDQGMATMLEKVKFQEFVICDIVAMYSSILAAVILIWAQLGDSSSMVIAMKLSVPLLGLALIMMCIAFMAGVYLVVSKLCWLANVVLFMGLNFTIVLILIFFPLCLLSSSKYHVFSSVSKYPFCIILHTLGA